MQSHHDCRKRSYECFYQILKFKSRKEVSVFEVTALFNKKSTT